MVDAYASLPHYLDHLAPVWAALPAGRRGAVVVPWQLSGRAARLGLDPLRAEHGHPGPGPGAALVLVAGYVDHRTAVHQGRRTVWLGHGAGQTYGGDPAAARMSGYPGGDGHEGCVLFMEAGEAAAGRWRDRYPRVPALAVGCPKLDAAHTAPPRARASRLRGATVALTFHADLPLCAETRSAWRQYEEHLPALIAELHRQGATVVGHAHPRLWQRARNAYVRAGAHPVEELGDVMVRADVLAVDNSSAGPECASVGVPLVWLSPPWYRRDVEHGKRFWAWTDGQVECREPAGLPSALVEALADPAAAAACRERMLAEVYAYRDGHAAERAVAAILALDAVAAGDDEPHAA